MVNFSYEEGRHVKRTQTCYMAATLLALLINLVGCQTSVAQTSGTRSATTSNLSWHSGSLGCACEACAKKEQPRRVAMAPAPAPAPAPPPPAPVPSGKACAEIFFPTGRRETSAIQLTKCAPAEVQVGINFDYTITVTNLTNQPLRNVVVSDQLPNNYEMTRSAPAPTGRDSGFVRWALGDLEPQGNRQIVVAGMANAVGKMVNCVTVTFDLPVCLAIDVVNPQLALVKQMPAEVLKCDPVPVKLTVTNTGVGAARNVTVTENLPEGLETTDGQRSVTVNVGTLAQGQSREIPLTLRATRSGSFTNQATATGANGLSATAAANVVVRQPQLEIVKTGPELRYVGRPIEYTITVTNKGDGEARNVMLEDPVPAGTTWVRASDGGTPADNRIVWNLGTLRTNESRTVSAVVSGNQIGTVRNIATARAYCAEPVSDDAVTNIQGIPAILLEVIDLQDPVEVGANTTYEIVVTNQGSAVGTNITIRAVLEEQAQYIASSGATVGTVDGRTITFAPLPSLAPNARATWRVEVKALAPGDVRFKVVMNSDQIGRDVTETEATHFYQ